MWLYFSIVNYGQTGHKGHEVTPKAPSDDQTSGKAGCARTF